jgi:hypothetical protein
MMKLRVMLVCTLLLLAAVPTFALPVCAECVNLVCDEVPGAIEKCSSTGSVCTTNPRERCSPPFQSTVLTDWTVASIEISRPSLDSITITAPAVVAEVQTSPTTEQK